MGGQSEWFTTTLGNDTLIVSANAENIQEHGCGIIQVLTYMLLEEHS